MNELTHLYMGKPAKYWAELEAECNEASNTNAELLVENCKLLMEKKELDIEFKWLRGEYVRIRQRCDDLVAICARHDVPESELLEEK